MPRHNFWTHISSFDCWYVNRKQGPLFALNLQPLSLLLIHIPASATGKDLSSNSIISYSKNQDVVARLALEIGSLHLSPWTPHPWFFLLPQLESSNEMQQTVLLSLQAMSSVVEHIRHQASASRLVAFDNYARVLANQQRFFLPRVYSNGEPSSEVILPALVIALSLLEFEMIAPLKQHSWFAHACGCLNLMAKLAPESYQVSPFFEIFWHLRLIMVFSSFTINLAYPRCWKLTLTFN